MAKKTKKVTKESPVKINLSDDKFITVKKTKVVEVEGLHGEIVSITQRIDRIVAALSKAKSVKGL